MFFCSSNESLSFSCLILCSSSSSYSFLLWISKSWSFRDRRNSDLKASISRSCSFSSLSLWFSMSLIFYSYSLWVFSSLSLSCLRRTWSISIVFLMSPSLNLRISSSLKNFYLIWKLAFSSSLSLFFILSQASYSLNFNPFNLSEWTLSISSL